MAEDVTENLGQFRTPGPGRGATAESLLASDRRRHRSRRFSRYEVNVFVAHDSDGGAPVVLETNPTYPNLFGRIEHQGVLGGGFVTDHRMLRPGAVHRANGGYLMLPAAEVLSQPLVWLKLKDVLRTGRIRLENPAEEYALIPTSTLTPETIELDLKVVLVGAPPLYDSRTCSTRTSASCSGSRRSSTGACRGTTMASAGTPAFVSSQVRDCERCATSTRRRWRGSSSMAARLAESRDWLSTSFVEIAGLAAEASHWARARRQRARQRRARRAGDRAEVRRSNLIEQRLLEHGRARAP